MEEAYDELSQTEWLAIAGRMSAIIGHEIRNPLASLRGFTQMNMEEHPGENTYGSIMLKEIDRIDSIAEELLAIGKPKSVQRQPQDLKKIFTHIMSVMKQQAAACGVELNMDIGKSVPMITGDEKQLTQAFMNLIKNAVESMEEGGTVKVEIKSEKADRASIVIQDEGCGISREEMDIIRTPFYTTKNNGTGLGLLITQKIIDEHNGQFKIMSEPGVGTKVRITLPAN